MKRNISFLMVFILLAALLAACSTSTNTSDPSPTAAATATTVKPTSAPEPAEINLVTPDATITPEFLEQLQKKFPHYKITHINQSAKGTTITDLITTGIPIDIIGRATTGYVSDAIDTKLAVDMTALVKEYNINLSDFEPQLVQFIRDVSNGGLYGIPGGSAINHILFYNKTIFDKFGVPYLKNGMSWEEVMDIAAKLTRKDGDVNYYGFTGHTGIMASFNQLEIPLIDKATNKPTINTDPRWKQYFQIIYGKTVLNQALTEAKIAFSGDTSRLVGGKYAMLLFNAGISTTNKDLLANLVDWDMVSLPTFKDAPNLGSPMNSTLWGITSQTRNKKAAMEVIQYMVSEEVMVSLSKKGFLVPMIKDSVVKAFATEVTDKSKNWSAITFNKYAKIPYKSTIDSKITPVYQKAIQSYIAGQYDMNTALRTAEEEAQQIITEESKK